MQVATFISRYPGHCAKGDAILAGEEIFRTQEGRYQHKECEGAVQPVVAEDLTPGMYRKDGEIYKVQKSRDSDRLYAKQLVPIGGKRLVDATEDIVGFEFEYEPGAVRRLTLEDRLPLEEAKAFGLRYGFCAVCGLRLKDAHSVQQGIGPVCIKRFNW